MNESIGSSKQLKGVDHSLQSGLSDAHTKSPLEEKTDSFALEVLDQSSSQEIIPSTSLSIVSSGQLKDDLNSLYEEFQKLNSSFHLPDHPENSDLEVDCEYFYKTVFECVIDLTLSIIKNINSDRATSDEKGCKDIIEKFKNQDPLKDFENFIGDREVLEEIKKIANKYSEELGPHLSILEKIDNISSRIKTDLNISGMGSRESTQSSGSSYLDQLRSKSEEYRSKHKRTYFNNRMVQEGSCEKALDAISRLFKTSHVVVLGEGSHDELALDAILRVKEGFPSFLKKQGVKTVIVEHVYPIHIEKLTFLEQSELMDHLKQSFGGNENKAINLLHFLKGCYKQGIKIVAADTREIHRPSGIDMTRYNATYRIENLNHNILTLYKKEKTENPGKFLIIVGAAHTNSLNAEASRESIDKEIRNTDRTPGITDVLDEAQEIIVKKYIPEEKGPQEASIKDGCVFRLKIQ